MPRREQRSGGDFVYHVLNRAAKRSLLFAADADYFALEGVMDEARKRTPIDLLAYCIMPNHWHFILLPESGQQMSQFMHWLTLTHAHRWQIFHQTIGTGAVYQGRYKAIPIQTDSHFLNVCRYVERNPLRAGLVERAQDWRWSSLWRRHNGLDESLSPWPVSRPSNWTSIVNGVENDRDLGEIRLAVRRGAPFGDPDWTLKTAGILGLESKLRPRGRPKKDPDLFSGQPSQSGLFPRQE